MFSSYSIFRVLNLRSFGKLSVLHKFILALLCCSGLFVLLVSYAIRVLAAGGGGGITPVYPGAPAYIDAAYKFDGNITSIQGRPADPLASGGYLPHALLLRQPDCSLNGYVLTSYTALSSMISSQALPNYECHLHTLAGLTTTPDLFPKGCQDPVLGLVSSEFLVLGKTSSGKYLTVFFDENNNNLHTAVVDPAGSYADTQTALTNVFTLNAGDLNGDGNNDVVLGTASGSASVVETMLSNGDGTYQTPVPISAGQLSGYAVDDFNGDGKPDIAVVAYSYNGPGALRLYPGKGDGTFGTAITSAIPQGATFGNIVSYDFNGDGHKDLLIGNGVFLVGAGDGTFTIKTSTLPSGSPVIADFNNDGKADVAFMGNTISVYLGNGDFTFSSTGIAYAGVYGNFSGVATDIDGDGNLDLVLGDGSNGVYKGTELSNGIFMILMGRGDGTFVGARAYSGDILPENLQGFTTGDFNGDGNLDVLGASVTQGGSSTGFVLLTGDGKGNLTPQTPNTSIAPNAIYAADVNGDKHLDAVGITSDPNTLSVTLSILNGRGDGTFLAPASYLVAVNNASFPSTSVAFANFRGTSLPDAAVSVGSVLYLLKNNGDGTLAASIPVLDETSAQISFSRLTAVDLNGDGKADIVADMVNLPSASNGYSPNASPTLVFINKGDGTFLAPVPYSAGGYSATADINNDNKPDIVIASTDPSSGNNTLTSFLGRGDGTFSTSNSTSLNGLAIGTLAIADVDGDGNPDVMVSGCCGTTFTTIALGQGNGSFSTNYALSFAYSSSQSLFGDLNNDGHPDVLINSGFGSLITSLNRYAVSTVAPAASVTTVSVAPNPATTGQSVTLTAQVTGTGGTPTGTVTFLDGATSLGTGTLAAGTVKYSTSALAAGTHTITAVYGGDPSFNGSTSAAATLTVNTPPIVPIATTTTLLASANTVVSGAGVTFTASIAPASGTAQPTGSVNFTDETTLLGTVAVASGKAAFTSSALAVGAHTITAAYEGSTSFAASTSAGVAVSVTSAGTPDFSLALSPASATVSSGGSVSSTLTLTPVGGFNAATTIACTGAPSHASCIPASTPLTSPDGSTIATTTINVVTSVQAASLTPGDRHLQFAAIVPLSLLASALLPFPLRRKRRWPLQVVLLTTLSALLMASGCGGKTATSSTNVPPGTYPLTVTGTSGTTTHPVTFTVTVQ